MSGKVRSRKGGKLNVVAPQPEVFLCPIGGGGSNSETPPCLTGGPGMLLVPHSPRRGRDPLSFAEGAEFADVCRSMIANPNDLWVIVRAANVLRLVVAAGQLGRAIAVHPIPPERNDRGMYGRVQILPGRSNVAAD